MTVPLRGDILNMVNQMIKKLMVLFVIFLGIVVVFAMFFIKLGLVDHVLSFVLSKVGGTKVTINSPGAINYTDAGAQYSTNGKLPDGFPKDFPILSTSQITNSWKTTNGKTIGYSIIVSDKAPLSKVFDFYVSSLSANEWKVTSKTKTGDNVILSFEKENLSGYIGFVSQNGQTVYSVTVGSK